jgi:enoyl-CoA hydratase
MSRGPIGLAELAVGVPYPTSAIEIVRGLVGPRSTELVLSARNLDEREALAAGLVDELTGPDDLIDTAVAWAARFAALPAGVFAHTKRQLQGPTRERIAARQDEDDRRLVELWTSPSVRGAIDRYLSELAARPR